MAIVTQEFNDHCVCLKPLLKGKIGKQTFTTCSKCGSLYRIETETNEDAQELEEVLVRAAEADIEGCYKIIQHWSNQQPKTG